MIETARTSETVGTPRAAVWEDFVDIFFAPSEVFTRRAKASPWVPLAVLTLAMSALIYVNSGLLEPIMTAEFNRSIAATVRSNPSLTPEMLGTMRRMAQRIGQFGGLFVPIGVLVTGTTMWLIGKLFEARQTYRAAIVVAAYSFMPRALEAGVNELQGLLLDPARLDGRFRLTFGVGRFLDPDTASPILLALVGRIDVFTLWVTALLAIGLSITGRIPRAQAFLAAALLWMVGAIPLVFQALRS